MLTQLTYTYSSYPVEFTSPTSGPLDNAEEKSVKRMLHWSHHADCLLSKIATRKLR